VLPAEETFQADGRSDKFQIGECLTLPFTAVTFGSRSGWRSRLLADDYERGEVLLTWLFEVLG
jgi:hypothetical protein